MAKDLVLSSDIQRVKQRFGIVGNSPALNAAIERAVRVAPIDLSVLVYGESGTGKESFPKIIHQSGSRKHKKYIAVNCGAIPEGTIDSELFGHEKGSFTGAISDRKGYFEEANGGTIFLDEVAELPLTTQARLLRVLESGEYLKVGSSKVQTTDVRIVAATNVDLLKAVSQGKFREDLYYRLSTVIIRVPNLHDRGDDIDLLALKFSSDFAEKFMTEPIRFGADALQLMHAYRWPGNVRQLKNAVEQLALFNAGQTITRVDLGNILPLGKGDAGCPVKAEDAHTYEADRERLWHILISLKREVEELRAQLNVETGIRTEGQPELSPVRSIIRMPETPFDPFDNSADFGSYTDMSRSGSSGRDEILRALRHNNGNKRKTAQDLALSERTLYRRIKEFGITDEEIDS